MSRVLEMWSRKSWQCCETFFFSLGKPHVKTENINPFVITDVSLWKPSQHTRNLVTTSKVSPRIAWWAWWRLTFLQLLYFTFVQIIFNSLVEIQKHQHLSVILLTWNDCWEFFCLWITQFLKFCIALLFTFKGLI